MYRSPYELKDLFDSRSEQLRIQSQQTNQYIHDTTILGPCLWENPLTIEDLEEINLDDFDNSLLNNPQHQELGGAFIDYISEPYEELKKVDYEDLDSNAVSPTSTFYPESQLNDNHGYDFSSFDQTYPHTPSEFVTASKKKSIPSELKNEKYWSRRLRNNVSAKKSRDARRQKENEISARAVALEKENADLKLKIAQLAEENMSLKQTLAHANHPTIVEHHPSNRSIPVTNSSHLRQTTRIRVKPINAH